MENVSGIVQILGVLGIGTVGAALVVAFASRKKVGSETNQNIVATADQLIDIANEEVKRARAELAEMRAARDVWERERRGWYFRADLVMEWARMMIQRARERGDTDVPAMPKLYPGPDARDE